MSRTRTDDARLLLRGLRALIRTQQIADRANVACCGMTVAQAATLHVLYLEGTMRLGALSERLGVAPSTLTRNVERIEERGWVKRIDDRGDGRACCLRLTAEGKRQAEQFEKQNEQGVVRLLEGLPEHKRKRVIGGLMDLLEAIDRTVEPGTPDQFAPIREFLAGERVAKE